PGKAIGHFVDSRNKCFCLIERHRQISVGLVIQDQQGLVIGVRFAQKEIGLACAVSFGAEVIGAPQQSGSFGFLPICLVFVVDQAGALGCFVDHADDSCLL